MQYIYLAYACSKSIIKSLQQRTWRTSFVFQDNFEHVFAFLLYPSLLLVKSRRFYQQEIVKLLTEKYQSKVTCKNTTSEGVFKTM